MTESLLHDRENNDWSEQFLKDNREKFNADCIKVLELLYRGMKLTAKNVNDITGMADGGRRLREIFSARKDCKKARRGKEGVEYWLEITKPMTKGKLVELFQQKLFE